jgi:hypothetical protein
MKRTLKLPLRLWWRRPSDPKKLGAEAVELAALILKFSDGPDVGKITNPVREGFANSFAVEGGGRFSQKWADLADRTNRERTFLGFPAAHPILERTGRYKHSWITRTAADHFEKQHRGGALSGANFVGQNMLTINVGSVDYRVPTLEGGMAMPSHLIEREQMLRRSAGMVTQQGSSAVPPRPVRYIEKQFLDRIGKAISFLLGDKVNEVKGPA